MRTGWFITICLLIIGAVSLFLWCIESQEKLSNIVQADAIIALVFVTLFYARQTQKLVEHEKASLEQQKALIKQEKLFLDEEKNKRIAEFGEKRIEKSLIPLLEKLEILEESLNEMKFDMQNANEIRDMERKFNDFDDFRKKKSYMATHSLTQELINFRRQIKRGWITGDAIRTRNERVNWRDDFLRKTRQIMLSVGREYRSIMIHLRKTYGYFSGEEE